jgi:hypothetical protein
MSLASTGIRLTAITRELRAQWGATKEYWTDARSQKFEQKYIEELMASVDRASTVIESLDKLLTKIKKDCE